MKITNLQMVASVPAFNELNKLKLPVKTSYWIAKASRLIEESMKDYREALTKLQQKHAELDDDGKVKTKEDVVIFKSPEAFQEEYAELLSLEVELNLKKISLDDFGDVHVEPSFLYHLDWFLED